MKKKQAYSFFYRNGLTILFALLTIASLAGQIYSGYYEHNQFLEDYHRPPETLAAYLISGHFIQATFENWESEFLQMALFVIATISLRQKGSSESNELGKITNTSEECRPKNDSPLPVKKGGIWLAVYKHSLSIALMALFILSFALHWYGSWLDHNEKQLLEGKLPEKFTQYIFEYKFWFESFQNWQSEFLSVFAIIFLSIYLRQIGSSQSKKVNDPHEKTGCD